MLTWQELVKQRAEAIKERNNSQDDASNFTGDAEAELTNEAKVIYALNAGGAADVSDGVIDAVSEHWQKTYDILYDYWKSRNHVFLLLVLIVGLALMLSIPTLQTEVLFTTLLQYVLEAPDRQVAEEFGRSFPISVLRSMLTIPVFYIVFLLYQRHLYLIRNFKYMLHIENEIKFVLPGDFSTIFTREGSFYQRMMTTTQTFTQFTYYAIIGILVILFFSYRIATYLAAPTFAWLPASLDIGVGLVTAWYLSSYFCTSYIVNEVNKVAPKPEEIESRRAKEREKIIESGLLLCC